MSHVINEKKNIPRLLFSMWQMKNSANSTHLFIIPVYPNIRDIRVDIKESVHQTRPCENTALCNDRYLLIIVLARTLRQTSFWPFWCSAIIMQVRVYIDEVLYYFTFIKFFNFPCIFLTPNLFFLLYFNCRSDISSGIN